MTNVEEVVAALRAIRFEGGREEVLCAEVDRCLVAAGITFRREVVIGEGCRIDRLAGTAGIEVKKGFWGRSEIVDQATRYAETGELTHLIFVSEFSLWLPRSIAGIPMINVPVHRKGFVA